jgi:hypothetical protein
MFKFGDFLVALCPLTPYVSPVRRGGVGGKVQNKKAELTAGSSFGSSAIFDLIRPAAFRALLTEGLALSRSKIQKPPRRYRNLLEA